MKKLDKLFVENALKKVVDPELGHNIVDLGLVYNINVEKDRVHVLMTFTTPLCPFGDSLVQQSKKALLNAGAKNVEIEITFDPPWGLDKMKDEIKQEFMLPIDV